MSVRKEFRINLAEQFWLRCFPEAPSDVSQNCSHLKFNWGWRIHFQGFSSENQLHSRGWQVGAGYWWETSFLFHVDLPARLLECPHNMAADLSQSKWFERARKKLQCLCDLVWEATHPHFCILYSLAVSYQVQAKHKGN